MIGGFNAARPGVGIGSLTTAGAVSDPSLNGLLLRERAGLVVSGATMDKLAARIRSIIEGS